MAPRNMRFNNRLVRWAVTQPNEVYSKSDSDSDSDSQSDEAFPQSRQHFRDSNAWQYLGERRLYL